MGGPLALLTGQVLRDRAPQRHGELRRELALSGRPATPHPPSGESEEEGGDAEGDTFPAPAPQPMAYLSPRATTHTVAHSWRTDGGGGAEGTRPAMHNQSTTDGGGAGGRDGTCTADLVRLA